jgi:Domain of unknown function (DUF4399)
MKLVRAIILTAALAALPGALHAQGTPAPPSAEVYFVAPEDNETAYGSITVRFGLSHMGVTHAGDSFPNSGHHHLLIDVDELPSADEPIPLDKQHRHFGAGETEAQVDLPPGKHTLQLVLGDANHYMFKPPVVSKKITVWIRSDSRGERRSPRRHRRRRHRHRGSSDYRYGDF